LASILTRPILENTPKSEIGQQRYDIKIIIIIFHRGSNIELQRVLSAGHPGLAKAMALTWHFLSFSLSIFA